jgi:hypothetical protein
METLKFQFQEFLNHLGTDPQIAFDLKTIKAQIRKQVTDADDWFLDYWAARIYFFTNGETGAFTFTLPDNPDPGTAADPTTISLSYHPDYSS